MASPEALELAQRAITDSQRTELQRIEFSRIAASFLVDGLGVSPEEAEPVHSAFVRHLGELSAEELEVLGQIGEVAGKLALKAENNDSSTIDSSTETDVVQPDATASDEQPKNDQQTAPDLVQPATQPKKRAARKQSAPDKPATKKSVAKKQSLKNPTTKQKDERAKTQTEATNNDSLSVEAKFSVLKRIFGDKTLGLFSEDELDKLDIRSFIDELFKALDMTEDVSHKFKESAQKHRRKLEMRLISGMTPTQIAERLGESISTYQNTMTALKQAATKLTEEQQIHIISASKVSDSQPKDLPLGSELTDEQRSQKLTEIARYMIKELDITTTHWTVDDGLTMLAKLQHGWREEGVSAEDIAVWTTGLYEIFALRADSEKIVDLAEEQGLDASDYIKQLANEGIGKFAPHLN